MIIARSPLRISLGGGGTDLPSYYRQHTGFVMSAAIDKYVYITLNESFFQQLSVRYSKMELVRNAEDVQHPIVRQALALMDLRRPKMDIACMADVPAGTGLGSSGSFCTALLCVLYAHKRIFVSPQRLARKACEIEIDILKEPVGKQDPYIAACGGITEFTFLPNDEVEVAPITLDADTLASLEENLLLFFTGATRLASEILQDQDAKTQQGDEQMVANLHFMKQLGYASKKALESGALDEFADLMNVHWERKRARTEGMSNSRIDEWYALARRNGALGGKLVGAGGGGFLMFYAKDKERLRAAMRCAGLEELRFRFDFQGTRIIAQS
jgi:D-glycero-alpha-D-manno-heptose-7-phosphate kinase